MFSIAFQIQKIFIAFLNSVVLFETIILIVTVTKSNSFLYCYKYLRGRQPAEQ